MLKDKQYYFSEYTNYSLNKLFQNILKDTNLNMEGLSKKLKVSKTTLYDLKDGFIEDVSLNCISSVANLLKLDPITFKYQLESTRRHLSIYSGVTEPTLYRLCELYNQGYQVHINEFTSPPEIKKISSAGYAYKSRPSEIIIVEDWNELKKSYFFSTLSEYTYFSNYELIQDIIDNDKYLNYKIFCFGIQNTFFDPFNLSLFDKLTSREDWCISKIKNNKIVKSIHKEYTYELIFNNIEEMQIIKNEFNNIKGLNIKFTFIPTNDLMIFDYIPKNDYFEFDLFFQVLSINYTYLRFGKTYDNNTELMSMIKLLYDPIKQATKKAIELSEFIKPTFNIKDYYSHDALFDLFYLISKSNNWKKDAISVIDTMDEFNIDRSFLSFFFLYSILISCITYLRRDDYKKMLDYLDFFLNAFRNSSIREKYIKLVTFNEPFEIVNPESKWSRAHNETIFIHQYGQINRILESDKKHKITESTIRLAIQSYLNVETCSKNSDRNSSNEHMMYDIKFKDYNHAKIMPK